jgi:hypothetical protein
MKLEITVSEAKELIKGIQEQPEHFFFWVLWMVFPALKGY